MAYTWTGKQPKMDHKTLRLRLLDAGAATLEGEWYGSGDSADAFDITIERDKTGREAEIDALNEAYNESEEEFRTTLKKRYSLTTEEEKEENDKLQKEVEKKHRAIGAERSRALYLDESDIDMSLDDIRDIMMHVLDNVGAAFNFNEEGCDGRFEWDLKTNDLSVSSGNYSRERDDSGSFDDVLGVKNGPVPAEANPTGKF